MITIDAYLTSSTKNVDCTEQVTQITWVQWKKWQVNILYVDRKFTHALRACNLAIFTCPPANLSGPGHRTPGLFRRLSMGRCQISLLCALFLEICILIRSEFTQIHVIMLHAKSLFIHRESQSEQYVLLFAINFLAVDILIYIMV